MQGFGGKIREASRNQSHQPLRLLWMVAPVKGDNMTALNRILHGGPLPNRPKRPRHQHHVGDDGFLTTKRSGYPLCPGWQDGTCTDDRSKGWCKDVPNVAHQCARCLSQEHGAHACQRPAAHTPGGTGWTGYARSKRQPVLTFCTRGGRRWPGPQPRAQAQRCCRASGQTSFRGGSEQRECF